MTYTQGAAERAWRIEELQRVRDGLKIKACPNPALTIIVCDGAEDQGAMRGKAWGMHGSRGSNRGQGCAGCVKGATVFVQDGRVFFAQCTQPACNICVS